MTREEAINMLYGMRADNLNLDDLYIKDKYEALDMAIKALEQEPTTKNDLGVDWESYKDLDGNSLDDLILEVLQNNFDCGNTYGYKVADEIIGLLPSVTPIRPKGHWIVEKGGSYPRNGCCSNCKDFSYKRLELSDIKYLRARMTGNVGLALDHAYNLGFFDGRKNLANKIIGYLNSRAKITDDVWVDFEMNELRKFIQDELKEQEDGNVD